ncbi:holo-ACP synthase [Anaeromyxobacter diazotrophicus]|uniref:Holo-[acyl-carrier-protein] synthase n=1 Tax=Anaeromyxobacter diazotrophicus TaxID=2590199 RepID=A0A7I9VLU9_9BACT|nr:holo-ACP synthase [Anaeromyxobacter diazotrophicus]GEJ57178.1 holo-[acyl-carrier-protein] synthase [Anaeromyxobacter diazotrophicus]
MVVGFGLDVVEIARIARQLGSPTADRFLARCFTAGERDFCDRFQDRAARYAARFAAKEAASKALGVPDGIGFHDVEVLRERGAPALALSGAAQRRAAELGVSRVHVTLSHDGGVAVAGVVLEAAEPAR